jgi:hypothetical protein
MPYKDRQQQLVYQRDWNARQKLLQQSQPQPASLGSVTRVVRQLDALTSQARDLVARLNVSALAHMPYDKLSVPRVHQAMQTHLAEVEQHVAALLARCAHLSQIAGRRRVP